MTDTPRSRIVFTEIPVADPARAAAFYETLLQAPLRRNDDGPNPIWLLPHAEGAYPVGHLYPGRPASDGGGMTAHFAVTGTLAEAMDRVRAGGGEVVSGVVDIPSGAFFYARDTEGNSLGLFRYH